MEAIPRANKAATCRHSGEPKRGFELQNRTQLQVSEGAGKRYPTRPMRVTSMPPLFFTSGCGDDRQLNESCLDWCMVDALDGFAKVARLGPKDVGNESLRIAVVQREPGRLDLDHDAVAGEEDVVCRGKREAVKERLVRRDGLGHFKTLAIAAAEDISRNHQLIAAHGRLD